jgi:polysaccharide chain length determinant protein (PEP-CTERM system associated)
LSPEHYIQLLYHRKWKAIITFVAVSIITVAVSHSLPNIYTSETVILVDPQKVPDSYVRATVTGDVRNRLGTLTQQILSATRLQKIIEAYGLYPEERKKMAREDVIAAMRKDINTSMIVGGGAQGDLQAFKVIYSGKDPRLVAQVTNQLAAMFIDENLKAREQQATGTTDFLRNQLDESRKALEQQERLLSDFKLKHVGEMPEQQSATLTVLGQLNNSLQQVNDALSRSEQQRSYLQSMMTQSSPVVDVDGGADVMDTGMTNPAAPKTAAPNKGGGPVPGSLADDKAQLVMLLSRYTETHPEVRKLRQKIQDREAKEGPASQPVEVAAQNGPPVPAPPAPKKKSSPPPAVTASVNPVLLSQLKAVEAEITKYKEEQQRLNKVVATYQAKLEAIPVREQQMSQLVRDYDMNKSHYSQLLDKQLSAETATQLEIRAKGERFSILDPAQPAQRPSKPNRLLIDAAGMGAGLVLGFLVALGTELFGMSILCAEQIPLVNGNQVLEVIPVIVTQTEEKRRRRHMIIAVASCVVVTIVSGGALLYHFRG